MVHCPPVAPSALDGVGRIARLFASRGRTGGWGRVSELSQLISSAEQGDPAARDALFAALYAELHRLARRELRQRGGALAMSVTTLLHEAYLDMAGRDAPAFADRARFMAYAARVMRGLIIDAIRERQALKRGGALEFTTLTPEVQAAPAGELSDLSLAVDQLATTDPALAEIVDLKFFCGFSFAEIAALRGSCERTVQRQWEKARIYLHRALSVQAAG